MTIRWTQPANDDFLGIIGWIAADNAVAASSVGRRILDAVEQLDDFPFRGRPARSPGKRELVFRPIEKIHLAMADQCSDQKSCHTGEGRCPWQNWIPASAGKTRREPYWITRMHLSTSDFRFAVSGRHPGPEFALTP